MQQASWDGHKNPNCQRCCDREETMEHIFSCTSTNACNAFKKSLTTLRTSLRKYNTAPIIITAFENIILRARRGYVVPLKDNVLHTPEMNQLIREIHQHQLTLPPLLFLRGYLSSNWDVT